MVLTAAEPPLVPRPAGLWCPAGRFYIDPTAPVERALITHAHADHARAGHGSVLASRQTLEIMAIRYGADFARHQQQAQGRIRIADAEVCFHPAGHVLGSSQIEISTAAARVVVTGDYCRTPNPVCEPWVPVPCDIFVTEATFALPVFRHPEPQLEIAKLLHSLQQFQERAHLVGVYALGKAQRLIMLLRAAGYDRPIFLHGALSRLCEYHIEQGIALGELRPATVRKGEQAEFAGELILAPPSSFNSPWVRRFPEPLLGFASGWMQVRARARQRGIELPLIISDHVDWPQLTQTLLELTPTETWITHGREDALLRWCEMNDLPARPLRLVGYDDEPD